MKEQQESAGLKRKKVQESRLSLLLLLLFANPAVLLELLPFFSLPQRVGRLGAAANVWEMKVPSAHTIYRQVDR